MGSRKQEMLFKQTQLMKNWEIGFGIKFGTFLSISIDTDIYDQIDDENGYTFWAKVYDGFFKSNNEPEKLIKRLHGDLKNKYSELPWYEIYDLLEFLAEAHHYRTLSQEFREKLNSVLEC